MLLHVLLVVVLPNFKFDISKDNPEPLTIEIVQPTPPAPVTLPEPVVEPEPIKSEPIKKPKLITEPVKPIPKKSPESEPIQEANPEPLTAKPPPSVITAAPKIDAPAVITAPPPEPIQKTEPNDREINAAREAYTQSILNELRRNHRYPRIAEQRGIQGEVKVKILIDKEGSVVGITVIESSGNSSLDEGAIATVKRSNLKQFYPEILRGRNYEFTAPIKFALINQ